MTTEETIAFKELFPKGLDLSGVEKESVGSKRITFLHVTDILNKEIMVDKFDFEKTDKGEVLYIHSTDGIIRTYSKMLINQAHTIDSKTAGKKIKLTIHAEKSRKNPAQTYYFFS